jgi:hypothetical protein
MDHEDTTDPLPDTSAGTLEGDVQACQLISDVNYFVPLNKTNKSRQHELEDSAESYDPLIDAADGHPDYCMPQIAVEHNQVTEDDHEDENRIDNVKDRGAHMAGTQNPTH